MSDDPNLTARRDDALPYAPASPPAGGRYALGAEIARGGMGAVFRATDTALGREVAVKLLQEQFGPDSGTARRFADEARIAGQLQHPGIPPIHDFGTLPDGRPFLAMKLIKGDTLDELLRARRDPGDDCGRFVAVFEAVCQAVGYAHAHDVVHRDLKPANVMVGAFGEVRVMDWGLAKVLKPGGAADGTVADASATAPNTAVRSLRDSDADHTQAGAVMGTPAYMPPEQAAGAAHKVTPRSDVFGLGAVLAVILTGRPPFEAGSAETTRVKAAQGDLAECLSRLDDCGAEPELVALCKRCLSPRPADRPATAGEVAREVADFRAQAEARARQAELDRVKAEGERATAEATAAEQRKRRRVQLWLAAAVVLLVVVAGSWGTRSIVRRAQQEQLERERKVRAADAVIALLDQAKAALEAGDADRAAPFLDQAERRNTDDPAPDHMDRLAAYQRDLAMIRELDAVDDFSWAPVKGAYPPPEKVFERRKVAFARYGIVPGTTLTSHEVARVVESPIRDRIIAELDLLLAHEPPPAVASLLIALDPDPFRQKVRHALANHTRDDPAELETRPEWATQPTGLILAYCARRTNVTANQQLMENLVQSRPNDFKLIMDLAQSYRVSFRENPDEAGFSNTDFLLDALVGGGGPPPGFRLRDDRLRWYQAAVALRPRNAVAHENMGLVLLEHRDLHRAAAAFREAVRWNPHGAGAAFCLGWTLIQQCDLEEAAAVLRSVIRIDPKSELAHTALGTALQKQGRLTEAVNSFQTALTIQPSFRPALAGLDYCLRVQRGEVPTAPPPRVRVSGGPLRFEMRSDGPRWEYRIEVPTVPTAPPPRAVAR